jgi:hypothetical protein
MSDIHSRDSNDADGMIISSKHIFKNKDFENYIPLTFEAVREFT